MAGKRTLLLCWRRCRLQSIKLQRGAAGVGKPENVYATKLEASKANKSNLTSYSCICTRVGQLGLCNK
jgi:hypothetical protein